MGVDPLMSTWICVRQRAGPLVKECRYQLPHSFQGVRQVWRNFLGAMRRWRKDSFDYVYAIEGRHGDKRFHIHLVLRDADFTLEEVRFLWPGGQFPQEGEKNNG